MNAIRLLLPLDGSADAESILAAVLPLGERRPLRVTLLGAVAEGGSAFATERYLERARQALERPGVEVRVETCLDDPASAIVSHSISDRSDLIAMATHGRSGVRRLLMGSVTESVLRRATVPLLACRPGCRMEGWAHVVALDGSPRAESILDDVLPLTRLVGATLHLLHVRAAPSPLGFRSRADLSRESNLRAYLKQLARQISALGVTVSTAVRSGSAPAELLRYAAEVQAGVVAMATHGRSGLDRVLMGSVAEEVLRKVSCPVLLRRETRQPAPLVPGVAMA
jgi:nucleotide-binding universal stress UspA family protein